MKNIFLQKLYYENPTPKFLLNLIKKYNLKLNQNFYIPIIIKIENNNDLLSHSYEKIQIDFYNFLLVNFKGEVFFLEEESIYFIIINEINTFSKQVLKKNINLLVLLIEEYIIKKYYNPCFIIVGTEFNKIDFLYDSFISLKNTIPQKMFINSNILNLNDTKLKVNSISKNHIKRMCEQIENFTEQKNYESAINYLNNLFDEIQINKDVNSLIWVKNYLVSTYILKLQKINDISFDNNYICIDKKYTNISDIITYISSLIKNYIEISSTNIQIHKTIQKAIYYIEKNYYNPITLMQLAEYTSTSRVHICKLFNNELNISFINYLNKFRIEKAKELLLDKKNIISKVSKSTGFTSPKYFSLVFKKYVGVSPKKYQINSF